MANCSQCGSAVTEGATFCPVCGTPQTGPAEDATAAAAAAPPPAADPVPTQTFPGATAGAGPGTTAGGSASPGPYKIDPNNLPMLDRVAAGAAVVLFISLFLDWYHFSDPLCRSFAGVSCSVSANATAHGWMWLSVILTIVIIGVYALKLGFGKLPVNLPVTDAQVILGLTAVNLLLVVIAFLDKSGLSWSFGAFLGLLAAIVTLAPTVWPVVQKQLNSR